MSDTTDRLHLTDGTVLEPNAVVRSDDGAWVSCVYEDRRETYPVRRVDCIVSEFDPAAYEVADSE